MSDIPRKKSKRSKIIHHDLKNVILIFERSKFRNKYLRCKFCNGILLSSCSLILLHHKLTGTNYTKWICTKCNAAAIYRTLTGRVSCYCGSCDKIAVRAFGDFCNTCIKAGCDKRLRQGIPVMCKKLKLNEKEEVKC